MTPKEAKAKAARYCAYQERTQLQVRKKLLSMGLQYDEADEVLSELITEGFINEERFAISFAGGKFRMKKWGRVRIERDLRAHGLSDYCVKKGLDEIEDDAYLEAARALIDRKSGSLSELDPLTKKMKITRFMVGKGYEYDVINSLLNDQE